MHHTLCEALQRILFKRFKNEMKPKLSNEMQTIVSDEVDEINFDMLPEFFPLFNKYTEYCQNVRGDYNILMNLVSVFLKYKSAILSKNSFSVCTRTI